MKKMLKSLFYKISIFILILFLNSCDGKKSKKPEVNSLKQQESIINTNDTNTVLLQRNYTVIIENIKPVYTDGRSIVNDEFLNSFSEHYIVNNKRECVIEGDNIKVFIPRDCFMFANGNPYSGEVDVEIIEINSKEEIIFNNLQTYSDNGNLLETAGMLYVNVKTKSGENLEIKKANEFYVEFKSDYVSYDVDMQKFYGAYDDNNQMKWEIDGDLEKQMIIIPFEYIEYKAGLIVRGGDRWDERVEICNDLIDNKIKIKKFENTFIFTREFAKRFFWIFSLTDNYYYDKYFEHTTVLFDFYLDNADKDLWYCDSLLLDKILLDKDRILKEQINPYKFNEVQKEVLYSDIKRLQDYVSERRTNPIIIKDYGIDLSQENALETLLSMGISEEEAKENINWFIIQQSIIKELVEERNANYLNYAFKVNKLGWINIDKFISIPKNEQRELIVECSSKNEDELKCFLSFTQRNSVLSENLINNKVYFNGLPTGDTVNVFVYGYIGNNKAYFGYSKAITGKDYSVNVSLEEITIEELKAKLEDLI
jgi:hypothetical protein